MERSWELFNWLIKELGYKSYLEIGCRDDTTFSQVKAVSKVGVDPESGGTHRMTSDTFFKTACNQTFDLVFVDGLHERGQVLRDVANALKVLNPGGTIVLHDCDPPTEESQRVPRLNQKGWCGDCWKAYVELRSRPDLDAACTFFDVGMGVVRVRSNSDQIKLEKPSSELTWNDLQANHAKWLRQLPESELLAWICKRG